MNSTLESARALGCVRGRRVGDAVRQLSKRHNDVLAKTPEDAYLTRINTNLEAIRIHGTSGWQEEVLLLTGYRPT